jgi:hypothetical protein
MGEQQRTKLLPEEQHRSLPKRKQCEVQLLQEK